jgi:hypothetical protein
MAKSAKSINLEQTAQLAVETFLRLYCLRLKARASAIFCWALMCGLELCLSPETIGQNL